MKENPGQFLVNYQEVICIVVRAFVKTRAIHESDHDDYIQFVNEKIWMRMEKIRSMYNGQSLVRTYMSVVIRNLVMEKMKEGSFSRVEDRAELYETTGSVQADQFYRLVIRQELERLDKILQTFPFQREKLEFCLKVFYRIPILKNEFMNFVKALKTSEKEGLWARFSLQSLVGERDHYQRLSDLFNLLEGHHNRSRDSIRKWIRWRLDMIINLMNGTPRQANYNEETIQILFEHYYSEKQADIHTMKTAEMET